MTLSNPSPGHDPALPAVSRRALLTASPALLAPSLLAGSASASTETPVLRLYRERQALVAYLDDMSTPSDVFDQVYPSLGELDWKLTREPVTCVADLAAKVLALTQICDQFSTCYEPELLDEMEAILAGVL